MKPPAWLQELREVLTLQTHEVRQMALMAWESRWVIDVHAVTMLSEAELISARENGFTMALDSVQRRLGDDLAKLMGVQSVRACDGLGPAMEVRGDAWAIRREPNGDD